MTAPLSPRRGAALLVRLRVRVLVRMLKPDAMAMLGHDRAVHLVTHAQADRLEVVTAVDRTVDRVLGAHGASLAATKQPRQVVRDLAGGVMADRDDLVDQVALNDHTVPFAAGRPDRHHTTRTLDRHVRARGVRLPRFHGRDATGGPSVAA